MAPGQPEEACKQAWQVMCLPGNCLVAQCQSRPRAGHSAAVSTEGRCFQTFEPQSGCLLCQRPSIFPTQHHLKCVVLTLTVCTQQAGRELGSQVSKQDSSCLRTNKCKHPFGGTATVTTSLKKKNKQMKSVSRYRRQIDTSVTNWFQTTFQ